MKNSTPNGGAIFVFCSVFCQCSSICNNQNISTEIIEYGFKSVSTYSISRIAENKKGGMRIHKVFSSKVQNTKSSAKQHLKRNDISIALSRAFL